MKNYYDENYELLLRRSNVYKALEDEECEEAAVFLEQDAKGNEIIGLIIDGREWLLGSRYDNEYCIDKWVESITTKSYRATIYIFGMGDLNRIKKIAKVHKDNSIIVYEPSLSYFKTLMEAYDLSELICNDNMYLLAGEFGMKVLDNTSKKFIDSTNYRYNVYKIQPQYNVIYEEAFNAWKKLIDDAVDNVDVNKNTNTRYGMDNLKSAISNYYDCVISNNAYELKTELGKIMSDTVVIVSAGPSLDKNVELLKEVKNKALIIAVDTALRPLMKRGIRPDLTITIDTKKPLELFTYDGEILDIPIVTCIAGNVEVIGKYPGKRIYDYEMDVAFAKIYDNDNFEKSCLETGGSVANNAFTLVREAGFKNIILIGQDLAYPGNKIHAEETFKDRQKIDFVKKASDVEVEDIYGNKVYTGADMLIYLNWFENRIHNYPELNVVDATEGGAKIKGSKIMTFREAIDAYIKDLPVVDYEKAINDIPPVSEDERQRRLEIFYDFINDIRETREDIDTAMKLYDNLDKLNRSGKYSGSEFKRTVADVTDMTDKIKDSLYAFWMTKIKDEEEYDILGEIYENKDTVYDEIKLVIDSGKRVLEKYLESYDLIEGMMDAAIKEAKEKEAKR